MVDWMVEEAYPWVKSEAMYPAKEGILAGNQVSRPRVEVQKSSNFNISLAYCFRDDGAIDAMRSVSMVLTRAGGRLGSPPGLLVARVPWPWPVG